MTNLYYNRVFIISLVQQYRNFLNLTKLNEMKNKLSKLKFDNFCGNITDCVV